MFGLYFLVSMGSLYFKYFLLATLIISLLYRATEKAKGY